VPKESLLAEIRQSRPEVLLTWAPEYRPVRRTITDYWVEGINHEEVPENTEDLTLDPACCRGRGPRWICWKRNIYGPLLHGVVINMITALRYLITKKEIDSVVMRTAGMLKGKPLDISTPGP